MEIKEAFYAQIRADTSSLGEVSAAAVRFQKIWRREVIFTVNETEVSRYCFNAEDERPGGESIF